MRHVQTVAFVVAALFGAPVMATEQISAPHPTEVELFLRNAWSEKTTELGADEIYILVLGTSSDGRRVSTRVPANAPHTAAGHWDMNDNKSLGCNRPTGDSHCIENRSLGRFATPPGVSWDVVVAFMEEDHGLERNIHDVLREVILNSGGNFKAAVVNLLIGLVGLANTDSDDFIGSVGAHIAMGSVSWSDVDRIRQSTPYPRDRRYGFQMIGDGANYTAHIDLR